MAGPAIFGPIGSPVMKRTRVTVAPRAAARGTGFGVANALVDQTDRGYAGLSNIVAMGQNQSGEAIKGMGDTLGQYRSQAQSQAQRDLSGLQTGLEVAGTGAGMAGAYGLRMGS